MALKLAEAIVELRVSSAKFEAGLSRARRGLKRLEGAAQRMASVTQRLFFGAGGLSAGIGLAVRAFGEQERAERKVEDVLKATGNAAGFTSDQLKKMASDLQSVTTFGDEAILSAQALLLTFKEIKGDQFRQATEAAMDLAVVTGTSLQQAMLQLGKALNDPAQGLLALRRSGVSFTKQQIDMIKEMQKTGRLAEAQALILKELRGQFGGLAKGEAKTATGQLQQLKNTIGDLVEDIGRAMLPLVNQLREAIQTNLPQIRETVRQMAEWISKNSAAILKIGALTLKIGALIIILPKLIALLRALGVAFTFATGPVGALVTVLGLVTAAWATAIVRARSFRQELDRMKESAEDLREALAQPMPLAQQLFDVIRRERGGSAAGRTLARRRAARGFAGFAARGGPFLPRARRRGVATGGGGPAGVAIHQLAKLGRQFREAQEAARPEPAFKSLFQFAQDIQLAALGKRRPEDEQVRLLRDIRQFWQEVARRGMMVRPTEGFPAQLG